MTQSPESGTTDPSQPLQEPTPRVRASDADREAVVRTLHDAVARGLLSLEEGDERVTAAYAARCMDDLPRLTADLPPVPAAAPVAPGWRALALLAWLQLRTAAAGLSWRGARRAVRSRPRLAVAAVALLALLSVGAVMAGEGFDHGGDVEHSQEVEHG
jgi:hypothetical protein